MKKILPIIFFIFYGDYVQAQNVNFDWAVRFGSIFFEREPSVTLDAANNVYSIGSFAGTIDFDPGPGVFTLTDAAGAGFISKLDANGNFIWAKKIESPGVRPRTIKVDASGNIIILGYYFLLIDLDPGPAVVNGSPIGRIFIIKLDPSGNFVFGKTFDNLGLPNESFSLALDPSGNIYVTGIFSVSADFDPGPGIFNLPCSGVEDIFILKLDMNGNFVWAKGIGSTSSFDDKCNAIAVDVGGNVFLTGVLAFNCDFDPGPGVYTLTSSGLAPFVLKLNTNGTFVWAKHFAPVSNLAQGRGNAIAVDLSGNVFVGGDFEGGTVDFDPGGGYYPLTTYNGFNDAFICKLDVSGNLLWAKDMGGSFQDLLHAVTLDASGNVYATGGFYNTIDFDPGPGVYNLTSAGQADCFIIKFKTQGDFVWAKNVGGPAVDNGYAIVVDAVGNVSTIGTFENTADMDPGPGIFELVGESSQDIFILKLSKCVNNSFSVINATVCNNYILNNQTFDSSGIYTQTIPNAAGCDSIITLNLTINRKFSSVDASICEGQFYYVGGTNQTTSGIYHDTLLTSLGCDSIITTTLTVHPKPKPNLGSDGNLCTNTQASLTPGVFKSYLWQDNSTLSSYIVNTPGSYWVKVTDANNCTATDTLNVISIDTIPKNFLPQNQELCYGNALKIAVPGYADYLWSTGSRSDNISLNSFGTFYLTIKDYNNCSGTDSITLQRKNCLNIGIPNAFTPNGDTKNDIFKPTIFQEVKNFYFVVFNRYGQKVFETREYGKGWDGTFKGKPQPSDSYIYRVQFTNIFGWESVDNGSVLLIR